jgi:hypothetical protein
MKYFFYFVAALSACTAIYHGAALFIHVDNSPLWRHAFFCCLSLAGIYFFLKRPSWLIYPMIILTLQQLYSHGTYCWMKYTVDHSIHWLSVADIVLLPIIIFSIWIDKRKFSLQQ